MTPFELLNTINKEIDAFTPKLSSAINKALMYYGEGSSLVGFEHGKNENDAISFEESESIRVRQDQSPLVMLKVMEVATLLESNSSWRLIVDTKPADKEGRMAFRYTLIRDKRIL
ncbi:hypothetical protein DENIS_0483 [Desulfonema ishimotonii]|uniref:Uncharacterized protein n=1 Tax=Desulfonema ishimotonii TaxID=45657 RepID=A0A401FRF4_9BACT|nr:hypothetical protein [Desulfonema ishimotonii]GBC59544.1 hypothetical protein DENIS_0483 [Desulfonema ishimotonii]